MDIIFLCGLFPNETKDEIVRKSSGVIQNAADALQWAIVNGLDYHTTKLRIVNLPYVGSFPQRYEDFKLNEFQFSHNGQANDVNVGFVNLSIYKSYSRFVNAKRGLRKMIHDENTIILIYAMHIPFIKAATDLKTKNPTLKICLVVPDLPQFMGGRNNIIFNTLKNIESSYLKKLLKKIDSFVVLSDYMVEPLQVDKRPWVRMEGIFIPNEKNKKFEKEHFKTIFYSGTLTKRYGIIDLLDAFSMIQDNDFRLWICGHGDALDELNRRAELDKRIINLGQISREKVLELQQKATVLVNPRNSEGEFTKYSFPSKVMEYLGSGTPVVMHPLPGIPREYFEYCFLEKNETVEALSKMLQEVCNKSQSDLNEFGEKAKQFILNTKSPEKQGLKIFNLLNKFRNV